MKNIKIMLVLVSCLFFVVYAHIGSTEAYPTKPIRVIVPYAPGGTNDLIARMLQKPLGEELKGTIIVENISGGNTKLAIMEVMKAKPDGHTLLLVSPEVLMGYYYSGTYDYKSWEKLTVIAQTGETPYGFFEVRIESPFKTWADLVNFAKKNPEKKLTCGGPGAGGMMNLNVIETAKAAGIDVKYVPFAGAGPSGIALLGGHIDYRICMPGNAYTNIKAGKSRGLAISYSKRVPEMPDVPTFAELGLMSVVPPITYAFWGPSNFPENLIKQISKALEKAVKDPSFLDYCKREVVQPIYRDAQTARQNFKFFDENVGPRLEAAFPRK